MLKKFSADDPDAGCILNESTPILLESIGDKSMPMQSVSDADKLSTTSTSIESSFLRKRETDPGLWHDLSIDDVAYWINNGPSDCQHHDGPFGVSRHTFPD